MAEWFKAHAWNACVRESVPRVRIPLLPPGPVGPFIAENFTLKAAVLHKVGDIRYGDVADPVLHRGDILVKVKAATICGTDIRILRGRKTAGIRYPSILGHEFAGEVVETGGHAGFHLGQAVTACPAFACGHCDMCLRDAENLCRNLVAMGYGIDGAFAEYVRIPAISVASGHVFALPEGTSIEQAALAEPLACVINGQQQVGVKAGDVVVILGAGPIGLLHVKLARHAGAKHIFVSQTSALRRAAARAAGADEVINPHTDDIVAHVRQATNGAGADVAICAIGKPDLANDAVRMVRLRGRVNLFAGFSKGEQAELDVNAIHYNELSVTGAFGLTRQQFRRALHLITTGEIEVATMLTHRFGMADISSALATAEQGSAVKVVLTC
jgi:L-iditol 2-dehydrogenase